MAHIVRSHLCEMPRLWNTQSQKGIQWLPGWGEEGLGKYRVWWWLHSTVDVLKNQWTVYFKMVIFMLCECYLNSKGGKGNLVIFPLLLVLESEEGYQQVPRLTENHLGSGRTKLYSIFPLLTHVYGWGETLLLSLRTWLWIKRVNFKSYSPIIHSWWDSRCPRVLEKFQISIKKKILPFTKLWQSVLPPFHLPNCVGKLCLTQQMWGPGQKQFHLSWKGNLCVLSSSSTQNWVLQ